MTVRFALLGDIVGMAYDTLRTNKMRAALTILGVVIGITAIVGMTSLIRGFDESLRDSIKEMGPNTVFVAKFSALSFASGKEFKELLKRPAITIDDARAVERDAPSVATVAVLLGGMGNQRARAYYGRTRTKELAVLGVSENYAAVNFLDMEGGRFFTEAEVRRRQRLVVLGDTPRKALFPNLDPIGKTIRIGSEQYAVVGHFGPRPSLGGLSGGQDDLVIVPYTAFQKQFGWRLDGRRSRGASVPEAEAFQSAMIAAVPRSTASSDAMIRDIEQIMRVRHGLRLDDANDFDIITQDAALKMYDAVTGGTFIALVAISSIALMVGGIGVMAVMTISVTERTREIGVRKALGARRREILWQFLLEAVFLTSVGGILGIVFGAGIGMSVHWLTGFPVSLPWWSFALGLGFSGSVGLFFGMMPALRAARLDPIEALRHE